MILSADPPLAVERKSTIGGRKPAARKGVHLIFLGHIFKTFKNIVYQF